MKVGKTITAIHATSEDAKAALASHGSAASGPGRPAPAVTTELGRLLERASALRAGLAAGAVRSEPEPPAPRPARERGSRTPQARVEGQG
jgi:hypothetical protein